MASLSDSESENEVEFISQAKMQVKNNVVSKKRTSKGKSPPPKRQKITKDNCSEIVLNVSSTNQSKNMASRLSDSECEETNEIILEMPLENIVRRKKTAIKKNPPPKKQKSVIKKKTAKLKSSENDNQCSVCLNKISGNIGNPSGCKHKFCLQCIKKWAKEHSTCPLDRIQFGFINILDKSDKFIKRIDKEGKEITISICNTCFSSDRTNWMVSCDNCPKIFHINCLPNPESVPLTYWHCHECDGQASTTFHKGPVIDITGRVITLQLYKLHQRAESYTNSTTNNANVREEHPFPTMLTNEPVQQETSEVPSFPMFSEEPMAVQQQTSKRRDVLIDIMQSQDSLIRSIENIKTNTISKVNSTTETEIIISQSSVHATKLPTPKMNADIIGLSLKSAESFAVDILQPYYYAKKLDKVKLKEILKRVVPKVCKKTNYSTDDKLLKNIVKKEISNCFGIL